MILSLCCFATAFIAGLTTMIRELAVAPEGHEDGAGFHSAVSNFAPVSEELPVQYVGRGEVAGFRSEISA